MDLKRGKVAICLSGLVRTGIPAKKAFDRFFGHLDYDLFFHTWTTDCPDNLVETYSPTKYKIQEPLPEGQGSFGNMLYSMMMANRLKRQHELENDFRYGLVIKSRFDLIFTPYDKFNSANKNFEPRTIFCSGGNEGINHTDYEHHGISDLLFWGDSQSMDIACDAYMYYKHVALVQNDNFILGHKFDPGNIYYSPGNLIMDLCHMNNVYCSKYNNCNELPWRPDVGHLDPFTERHLILERYCRG